MRRIFRLFNFLAGLYELKHDTAEPMAYLLKRKGRVVQAGVYRGKADHEFGVLIRLQRKLTSGDPRDGRLNPIVSDKIVRRGGKRKTEVALSLEAAESLYVVLGKAISNAQTIKRQEVVSREMMAIMMTMTHASDSR